MRFYSKFVFFCNLCFIISAILRLIENTNKLNGNGAQPAMLQPLTSTLVILGYSAIFFNLIFTIIFLFQYPSRKMNNLQRYIVFFNLLLLPAQFYYFFISKF